ncbi:hypothetical protein N431DRAFT_331169, partial [Stipitochalara longipes BDJ]
PQEIVTIIVGKGSEAQTFKVHKDTICYYSPFFASAFNGHFLEGQSQSMKLDDFDGSVFGLLVAWLYTMTISDDDIEIKAQTETSSTSNSKPIAIDSSNTSARGKDALRLAKLWVLGQRFLIPDIQNSVIALLHPILNAYNQLPVAQLKEIVEYAYSGEYDELRLLVVEVLAFAVPQTAFSGIAKRLPQPALVDVTKLLREYHFYIGWVEQVAVVHKPEYFFVNDGTNLKGKAEVTFETESIPTNFSTWSAS